MNGLMLKLKRFFGNKNTITILGIIVGVAVLLVGYNYRVNQATKPMEIPYALKRLTPKSKVEADQVGTIKVSKSFVQQTEGLIQNKSYIIGNEWYVNYDTVIPAGGLFYDGQLVKKEDLPDTAFDDIPDGATVFSLSVNNHSTYGNSIMPGNFIDLYIRAVDENDNNKVIFGKFIESIEVLAVRDTQGEDVFADSQEEKDSGELLFAVKDDLFMILSEASFIGGIQIIPVPRNAQYRDEGNTDGNNVTTGTKVSREELVNYILDKVSALSDPIDIGGIVKQDNMDLSINNNTNVDTNIGN